MFLFGTHFHGGVKNLRQREYRFHVMFSLILFLSFNQSVLSAQQDVPISAQNSLPGLINPSLTGLGYSLPFLGGNLLEPGNHGFDLSYKSQLKNAFNNTGMHSAAFSYEGRFMRNSMSAGLLVYSNTLNKTALNDLSFMLTYAYHLYFGNPSAPDHSLSFGLQGGYRQWSFDVNNIQTGSMYDPAYVGGYNPSTHPELYADESRKNLFDANVGINYRGLIASKARLEIGAAAWHLFRPETNFLNDNERTPMKFSVTGSIAVAVGKQAVLNPGVIYWHQGNSDITEMGLRFDYLFTNANNPGEGSNGISDSPGSTGELFSLMAGFYYRSNNVLIPTLGIIYQGFQFKCSFEFYTSNPYNNLFTIGMGYRF